MNNERAIAHGRLRSRVAELQPDARITADRIAAFTMQTTGEIPSAAYIRAVVDEVELDGTEPPERTRI